MYRAPNKEQGGGNQWQKWWRNRA